MPHGVFNWTYRDVTRFIREHGFVFHKQAEGSHEYWVNEPTGKVVDINFRGRKAFRPKTLLTMIRQSGIDKKVW